MIPPNPYDNLPEVGSTTERFMTCGDYALLVADYLRRREEWLKHVNDPDKTVELPRNPTGR